MEPRTLVPLVRRRIHEVVPASIKSPSFKRKQFLHSGRMWRADIAISWRQNTRSTANHLQPCLAKFGIFQGMRPCRKLRCQYRSRRLFKLSYNRSRKLLKGRDLGTIIRLIIRALPLLSSSSFQFHLSLLKATSLDDFSEPAAAYMKSLCTQKVYLRAKNPCCGNFFWTSTCGGVVFTVSSSGRTRILAVSPLEFRLNKIAGCWINVRLVLKY